MTPDQQERFELSELELEAARYKQFTREGGWLWRLFNWFETHYRRQREDLEREMGLRK